MCLGSLNVGGPARTLIGSSNSLECCIMVIIFIPLTSASFISFLNNYLNIFIDRMICFTFPYCIFLFVQNDSEAVVVPTQIRIRFFCIILQQGPFDDRLQYGLATTKLGSSFPFNYNVSIQFPSTVQMLGNEGGWVRLIHGIKPQSSNIQLVFLALPVPNLTLFGGPP